MGVGVYAYVRGLILGCKLRDEDCSANVFSSKPWSVLRIIFITYIKAKSNYVLESLLFVTYGLAKRRTADVNENVYLFCPSAAQLPVSDITQRQICLPKDTQEYDKFTLGMS